MSHAFDTERSLRPVLALVGAVVFVAGCSVFGGDDSAAGTQVDRVAVDRALTDILEDRLAGTDVRSGVTLDDGNCPVLGDQSVADIVAASVVELDLDQERASGFLHAVGEGVSVSCQARGDESHVGITVLQTPALTAAEFADQLERFSPEGPREETTFETDIAHDEFRDGSLLIRTVSGSELVAWVDNGLVVSATVHDESGSTSRSDTLEILSAARDAVLETLQGSANGPGGSPGRAGGLDRDAILDALTDVEPELDGVNAVRIDDGPCPFLADGAFASLADDLTWEVTPVFDSGLFNPGNRQSRCSWGDGTDLKHIGISFGRPVSVDEVKAFVESPLFDPRWTVDHLDTSTRILDGRSFALDRGDGMSAGWVDNGLRIDVELEDREDPEEVLAAVVPAVLDGLGLS